MHSPEQDLPTELIDRCNLTVCTIHSSITLWIETQAVSFLGRGWWLVGAVLQQNTDSSAGEELHIQVRICEDELLKGRQDDSLDRSRLQVAGKTPETPRD